MPRVLAIDYGQKRTGLAHTDSEKMIASPLDTVLTKDLFKYLINYFKEQDVESVVVGNPKTLYDQPALISNKIQFITIYILVQAESPPYLWRAFLIKPYLVKLSYYGASTPSWTMNNQ